MQSGFHFQNTQRIRKLCILGLSAFLIDWYKRALQTLSFILDKWVVPCLGLYSIPQNTGGVGKACTLTITFLSFIVTTILLFGPIKARVILFDFGLVYLRAIQHLFLSSSRI